ncbi:MAG: hypothetical protein Q7R34_16765, partial [Dehalococcoidia bacterium]|nr:hypothetical protein [Dehalococcoidia bacterium]
MSKAFIRAFNKMSLLSIALALLMLLINPVIVSANPLLGGATNPADWTLTGPGTLSVAGSSSPTHILTFKYNYGGAYGQWHNWEFKAQAKSTETITLGWDYWPFHSWYQAQARLYLFADGPSGTTTQTLYNGYGYTRVNGIASINVTNGYNFGFKVQAYHYDSSKITNG